MHIRITYYSTCNHIIDRVIKEFAMNGNNSCNYFYKKYHHIFPTHKERGLIGNFTCITEFSSFIVRKPSSFNQYKNFIAQTIVISTHEFDAIWQLSINSSVFSAQHFSISSHSYVVAWVILYKVDNGTCWFYIFSP